jgi:hypothetical protein
MERNAREARKGSFVHCVSLRYLRALRSNVVIIGIDAAKTRH